MVQRARTTSLARTCQPRGGSRRRAAPITPLRLPKGITTVVVYGGMFDPPHSFHIEAVPRLIRDHLGAGAWLLYVPAAQSPLKPRGPEASDSHRAAMLRKAAGPQHVWMDECDRARWQRARKSAAPSYTVDTLRRLRSILPRAVKMRLLIGADQGAAFHRWKCPRAVIRLAEPLVMARAPIQTPASLARAMDADFWTSEEKQAWGRRLLNNPIAETSSSLIRERLRGDHKDRWSALPVSVARYIRRHGLYGWNP